MAKCGNCGRAVDGRATFCPGCGKPDPGAGQDEAFVFAVGFVIVVICGLFLAPAIVVIWPFSGGLQDAFGIAFNSIWAWIGSFAFWAVLGAFGYFAYQESKKVKP